MKDQKIEKIIRSSTASIEMEGFHITDESKELCRKLLRKEITMDEYIKQVKLSVGVTA